MARCRTCGMDLGYKPLDRSCRSCRVKWVAARTAAYEEAIAQHGPITAANHAMIAKQIVRETKRRLSEMGEVEA